MSRTRIDFHEFLHNVTGISNLYFQAPENVKIKYPCIIYNRSNTKQQHADNIVYRGLQSYTVTLIDKNPDSPFYEKFESIPYCEFERSYAADNLNHFVFTIYF